MSSRNSRNLSDNKSNKNSVDDETPYVNYRPSSLYQNQTGDVENEFSGIARFPSTSGRAGKKPQPLPKPSQNVREAVEVFEKTSAKPESSAVGDAIWKFESISQRKQNRSITKTPLLRTSSSNITTPVNCNSTGNLNSESEKKVEPNAVKRSSIKKSENLSKPSPSPRPSIESSRNSITSKVVEPALYAQVNKKPGEKISSQKVTSANYNSNNSASPLSNNVSGAQKTTSNPSASNSISNHVLSNKNPGAMRKGNITSSVKNIQKPQEFDDSNIYEDASAVQMNLLPTEEKNQYPGSAANYEEPLYEEALAVNKPSASNSSRNYTPEHKTSSSRNNATDIKAPLPSASSRNVSVNKAPKQPVIDPSEECLYEEAAAVNVNKLKETKSNTKPALKSSQNNTPKNKTIPGDASNLYESAIAVSLSTKKPNMEESLYDTALPISMPKESVYDTAMAVSVSKLSNNQSKVPSSKNSKVIASAGLSCVDENLYEEAAAVVMPANNQKTSTSDGFVSDENDDDDGFDIENQEMMKTLRKSQRNLLHVFRNDTILAKQKMEHDARRMSNNFLPRNLLEEEGSEARDSRSMSPEVVLECGLLESPRDEKMRKWVVTNILDSEKEYIEYLEKLFQYQLFLKSNKVAILNPHEDNAMFGWIVKFIACHQNFVDKLKPKLDNWSENQEVAVIYKELALEEFPNSLEYLKNYPVALATQQQKCAPSYQQFQLNNQSNAPATSGSMSKKSTHSLEELLHKPVVHLQRSNLMLNDLIKFTPSSHPDYEELKRIKKMAEGFLSEYSGDRKTASARSLIKKGILINLKGNSRKLRQVFLFSDVLVCTRQTSSRFQQFEVCWFIQLSDLQLEHKFSSQEEKKAAMLRQQENEDLQKKRVYLWSELKRLQTEGGVGGEGVVPETGLKILQGRNYEKIRKKLLIVEEQLVLQSAHLQLKVSDSRGSHILLLSSDYERNNWKDAIDGSIAKVQDSVRLSLSDVQNLINSQKASKITPSLSDDECLLEEETLSGCLSVRIHRLQGLKNVGLGTFCSIEIDSFGHFSLRAKTNVCKSADCKWNEDFDIDLEGAQTLHILCYQIGSKTDSLLGQCSLVFQASWLHDFKEQSISLGDGLLLTVSLKFISAELLTLKRKSMSCDEKQSVFGVNLSTLAKREKSLVPVLVTSCVEELEKRGLKEVGLYRVSGLSEHVEGLKKAFNKNCIVAMGLLKDTDSFVITSLLKQFFRELPEVLFTDEHYKAFVSGLALADPFSKEKFMISELKKLPQENYQTIVYFLHHLVRVSRQSDQNKMSLSSLATILAPTLLRPSSAPTSKQLSAGAQLNDAAIQATVLHFYLNLAANGQLDVPATS